MEELESRSRIVFVGTVCQVSETIVVAVLEPHLSATMTPLEPTEEASEEKGLEVAEEER